ncbi:ribosome-inactivating family protein [Streptomyces sp. NPDC051132]|uniref:ribosome-inactivating family protein n=1 Tax=unclassified Streptomyces TaxID=2593676 RepID=UPI00341C92A3
MPPSIGSRPLRISRRESDPPEWRTSYAQGCAIGQLRLRGGPDRRHGTAQRYYDLVAGIHRLSYGLPTHYDGLTQTTTEQGRLIQVRVLDTNDRHLASVYLWADNLYVAGIYAPSTNRHFAFDDRTAQFMNALGTGSVGLVGSGNYGDLAGGNDRQTLVPEPNTMYHAMQVLGRADGDTGSGTTSATGTRLRWEPTRGPAPPR